MRAAVIQFPGSNCDRDMAVAIREVTGAETSLVWHRESELPAGLDLIAVPGGFSYGDYLRSGAMAARSPVMQAVIAAAGRTLMTTIVNDEDEINSKKENDKDLTNAILDNLDI
jgi:phosphoribosylformylglycinamidine synthase